MAHQALARKYRPRTFSEVATQEHVSETLRRAVSGGRVAHAYLFCGPRGVGKTTLARVLAMALNCPRRTDAGEPCGTCESCTRIWSGHTALDVVEIDAASNRGVDDARSLRERAMYAPSEEERYKVYIVDEAHMLTREAWNALLKILEEPPPRVIFVFATTEPQKIQQTAAPILSRCQRFDFRRIGVSDIVARLRTVLEAEGTAGPDEALRLIARKADGGMRDGLSLLDQVLSLSAGELTLDDVRRVLGLVEDERYLELLDILHREAHGAVFGFVEELLEEGYDLTEFYQGLVDVLRVCLRLRLSGPDEIPDLRSDLREAYAERAARVEPEDLVRMLSMASELETSGSLRRSAQPRLVLEMLLLRLSYLDRTVRLEEIIRGLGGGGRGDRPGATGAPAGGTAPTAADTGSVEAPGGGAGNGSVVAPSAQGAGSSSPVEEGRPPRTEGAEGNPGTQGDAGLGGPDGGEAPAGGLDEAWARLLASGEGIPAGMKVQLQAARLARMDAGGDEGRARIRLELPPGPALERLEGEVTARRAVEEALSRAWGAALRLVPAPRSPAPEAREGRPSRIGQDEVREGRLRDLVQQEPLLGPAVEELDLELLD